jgi:phage N-6-adenine-methyltransferase
MKAAAALVQSVFDFAVREINALEGRIAKAEDDADAMLWEQARQVVEQLEAGRSRRKLAAQWINARTGEPYSHVHVHRTALTFERYFNVTPRPRFREAYNELANAPALSGKVNRLLHQSGDYEWFTPPDVVQAARDVLGTIDLDPASCELANTVVQAAKIYTANDNGLEQPWQGRVFLNPPYRQPEIKQFCEKFARHAEAREIQGIVLVNNATDTQWFATIAAVAHAFCFPSFRFRYWHPENQDADTALQGQVIVYTGPKRDAFCRRFAEIGLVLVRP